MNFVRFGLNLKILCQGGIFALKKSFSKRKHWMKKKDFRFRSTNPAQLVQFVRFATITRRRRRRLICCHFPQTLLLSNLFLSPSLSLSLCLCLCFYFTWIISSVHDIFVLTISSHFLTYFCYQTKVVLYLHWQEWRAERKALEMQLWNLE